MSVDQEFPEFAVCPRDAREVDGTRPCRAIDIAIEVDGAGHVVCGCARHATRWKCRRLPDGVHGHEKCKAAVFYCPQGQECRLPSNYRRDVDGVRVTEAEFRKALGEKQPPSQREALVAKNLSKAAKSGSTDPWKGTTDDMDWNFNATAVIPYRDTPEYLELCIKFLAQQTERPYIMVIDTGSKDEALQRALALRSESVEVHQIACHSVRGMVDVVCSAMDMAMSLCRTDYLWCLHSDCFIINRNLLAELLAKSDGGKHPVIGYESVSAGKYPECKGMVSHTCTLLHMPTMHSLDVSWSRARLKAQAQAAGREVVEDTEMALNYRLRDRGIRPLIIGPETQGHVERDANRVHLRSATFTADVLSALPRARSTHDVEFVELKKEAERLPEIATRQAPPKEQEITTLNLIYHVTPVSANDVWRRNVSLIRRYMHVFNGRRIVAIAIGKHGDPIFPPEIVKEEFEGFDVEFVHVNNDPDNRESASLPILLEMAFDPSPSVATFYGHTKGLSHPENRAVAMWYRSLYQHCLSDRDAITESLKQFACCGAFRKIGPEKHFPEYSQWHYSGTFFWFRNSRLYSHRLWREVDRHRYGAEAYMSKLFRLEESCCLKHDAVGDLYDINYWNGSIIPTSYAEALRI